MKDEELRRLSSALLVSDVDLIRLKVVNQLELVHKEEIDQIHQKINKKDIELAQLKSKYALVMQKNQVLTGEIKRLEEDFDHKEEETMQKHMREVKDLYDTM